MAGKSSGKKSGKQNPKGSSSGGIKKQQRIRTKLKIEQANNESFLISDLNERESKKKLKSSPEALKVKSLLKDQKKDRETQEIIQTQKKNTDSHMLRQLEQIAGFSL
ncbi:LAME_0G00298g1_1 [Lachancea meyersii CBS 8951]|uniref:LAME_0G00298g1_1 n=1 Tax=Lachancea meyersii CBS 8951 TaxID=1266667 RepID=A0A1G4K4L9_9SACH|nr:LAME_0G00298g1_1 [Lachancea meyersii CBS 8951]